MCIDGYFEMLFTVCAGMFVCDTFIDLSVVLLCIELMYTNECTVFRR